MNRFKRFWPFILIAALVIIFFLPVFKGYIPFPGDLLVSTNPYKTQGYLGFAPGGYPNKAQGPDVITEIYPWRYFSILQLKDLNIPFWNPYNFSGNPQMANFQTGIFYPFNLIYLILSFQNSWTVLIMLEPLLASVFMYLFLLKAVSLSKKASVLGGIMFGFSSYMTVWIEYGNIGETFLWFPLILLLTKFYYEKYSVKNFLALVIVLSFSILAGYIQGVFYIYILSFFYYLYLLATDKKKIFLSGKNFLFVLSLIFPLFFTAFQILPTLMLFGQSTRGAYSLSQIEKNLAPVFYWVTVFFPDFFGNPATRNYWLNGTYIERVMYPGSLAAFFAVYSLFVKKKEYREWKFFLIVSAVSLIIATNLPLIKYFYLIPIPVISTTVATREFSIFIFSAIVLGSIGLDIFLRQKEERKFPLFYILFLLAMWGIVFVLSKTIPSLAPQLKVSEHNMILPTVLILLIVLGFYLKKINIKLSFLIFLFIAAFDLFYFFNKITPFSPRALVYPETPVVSFIKDNAGINRYWGQGLAYIPANYQSVDDTFSPEGNDPLHISNYGKLLASSKNGKLPVLLPRPDANIYPAYGTNDLKNNFYRQRILNLLGVKYVLNQTQAPGFDSGNFPGTYKLVWQQLPWQIYQNLGSVPRFFLTGNYILAKNAKESLSFIYNPDINLSKTIILQKSPDMIINRNAKGKISLLFYAPNKVSFKTQTDSNMLLFLSDNYYPDWQARIDGKPVNVLPADYTFRAVSVPKGEHTVDFIYDPQSFKIGLGISALGLIMLFFMLFYAENYKKKL